MNESVPSLPRSFSQLSVLSAAASENGNQNAEEPSEAVPCPTCHRACQCVPDNENLNEGEEIQTTGLVNHSKNCHVNINYNYYCDPKTMDKIKFVKEKKVDGGDFASGAASTDQVEQNVRLKILFVIFVQFLGLD